MTVVDVSFCVFLKLNDLTATAGQFASYEELKATHSPLSNLSKTRLSPLEVMPRHCSSLRFHAGLASIDHLHQVSQEEYQRLVDTSSIPQFALDMTKEDLGQVGLARG